MIVELSDGDKIKVRHEDTGEIIEARVGGFEFHRDKKGKERLTGFYLHVPENKVKNKVLRVSTRDLPPD